MKAIKKTPNDHNHSGLDLIKTMKKKKYPTITTTFALLLVKNSFFWKSSFFQKFD